MSNSGPKSVLIDSNFSTKWSYTRNNSLFVCLLRTVVFIIFLVLDESTWRHETQRGCNSHEKGMSPISTKSFEGWIDIFNSFIAWMTKIKSTHLRCGKTIKLRLVNFFWSSETCVGEDLLLLEILYSFVIRTTIFGPRVHFPKRSFRIKKYWLAKVKAVAESIDTLVWYCKESCSIENGNFIRGSG